MAKKKFELIAQDLLSKIYQHHFSDKLPSERELAASYSVFSQRQYCSCVFVIL
ncbi:hypothetical protein L0B53_04335 [Vibrio sp. SS-MA-C1-2]|uniref:hypothetical protein n=1 Tax=Vibrio sp. SS-MA-C1-2 TaxID=2908646 RepID=UPI001F299B4E|nr:hypothetical protein [Vibrio sp. SS-MA-C1-2]UJF17151.1 hypothetical protein L0B53_04335 [Vibrio sp. SS-MA-C1-2]